MIDQFILIPGRSSRQGVTLNEGKYTDGYKDETSVLRINPADMERLELSPGDDVRMWNDIGEVVVSCIDAGDECPEGLVFICYGDKSSQLMGGETHGSGMPDSKALDVYLWPAAKAKPDVNQAAPAIAVYETPASVVEPSGLSEEVSKAEVGVHSQPTPSTATTPIAKHKKPAGSATFGTTLVMMLFVVALVGIIVLMNLGG